MAYDTKEKEIILVIDDDEISRLILRDILECDYTVIEACGGGEAIDLLYQEKLTPAIILLDIIMPGIDGFQVLEKIKNSKLTKEIPVLFISAETAHETETRGLKAGAADYITKPFNSSVVRARVDNQISLSRYRLRLRQLVARKAAEVTKTYEQTLEILTTIIEYRNLESGAHVRRTTLLTEAVVAKMLTLDKFRPVLLNDAENLFSLIKASALHDIGKIGVSDSVLLKPGKLTDDEFDHIKTHTTAGAHIIDSISATLPDTDMYLRYAKDICFYHHERWDGRGYPQGLSGDNIPLSARIVSVVDVYDALVNPRSYKGIYTHDEALKIITNGHGTQFDPHIVELVSDISTVFQNIEDRYGD